MVFNALKSIATFLARVQLKKIRSVDERWHLRSANSVSTTSPSHWPSSGDGVGVQRLASAGPQLQDEAVVHIGKQRLYKPRDCHQILTSSRTVRQRQNDDLRFCLPCGKCDQKLSPELFVITVLLITGHGERPFPFTIKVFGIDSTRIKL